MLPTLLGRIQTRIFVTAVIGGIWALLVGPFLPAVDAPLEVKYKAMYGVLLIVGVLGVLWELVYHALMQFRWEKDWPTLFGLVTAINEGIVAYYVAHSSLLPWTEGIPVKTFVVGFGTAWLVIWLFVNGPMRIFTVHWRFRGGRLI
jgi:hypothetical protein